MGVKISSLPVNTLPYTGAEKIPLVQNGETRAGTLSSLANYLVSDSELAALSGNWQNTYTSFNSNSANFAVKNANNNFTAGQTITGSLTAATFVLSGGTSPLAYSMKRFNGTGSFGITNTLPSNTNGNYIIALGNNAGGGSGGGGGTATDIVSIGNSAGNGAASSGGIATDIIAIGNSSGYEAGAGVTGDALDIIAIGKSAGYQIGQDGYAQNVIVLGQSAGGGAGNYGTATDVVAIGKSAGDFIGNAGTATDVVAIGKSAGQYAGYNAGTAIDIVAIGNSAGSAAGDYGSATDLISIGNLAGSRSGAGDSIILGTIDNVIAIGKEAGYESGYTSFSNNNIFIGLSSGYTKQGDRNTFIGDLTNTSPTSAVNLSGCIALGYGATPTARNTIAIGSTSTPLSVVPGGSITNSLSGLKIMINGRYYTIPLLA